MSSIDEARQEGAPRAPRDAREPAPPHGARNPGVRFDRGWIDSIRVNLSAAERRVESLGGRRTVKSAWQAAWLHADSLNMGVTIARLRRPSRAVKM